MAAAATETDLAAAAATAAAADPTSPMAAATPPKLGAAAAESNGSSSSGNGRGGGGGAKENGVLPCGDGSGGRRTRLPVTQPDKSNINLWSYLKQCIGKELTKISMPVQWNEPISLLQRISENMNTAQLLHLGSQLNDAEERLAYVATFAVSSYASNHERMGKPFNPLLGETYELERDDFKIICEQVGHHPPVSAFHAQHPRDGSFVFKGSVYPKVKFWGKSVEFQPKGTLTVEFPRVAETYTWQNVNCVVHNIIVGSLWMEQTGTMEIVNQTTKHKCVLTFRSGGWFSDATDLHTVEGFIVDRNKKKLKFLYGRWTEFLCAVDVAQLESHFECRADKVDAGATNLPKHAPLAVGAIPGSQVLWQVEPRPEDSEKYYNFNAFAMGLNEMSPGLACRLSASDCRRRPDIRALENGEIERAVDEKDRLENKQRDYRRPFKNKKEQDWWTPVWFMPAKNEFTKDDDWKFLGGYWEREWKPDSQLDIF